VGQAEESGRLIKAVLKLHAFARKLLKINLIDTAGVQNEVTIIKQLCDGYHKNIVQVFGDGSFEDRDMYVFIDMELCDLNLEEYNKARWTVFQVQKPAYKLRDHETWVIMTQIASALAFVHSKDLVHRDLKPPNGARPSS
jgi:serine/threonine protein kinase